MFHIRPHQVLKMADSYGDEIKFFMPSPVGGSMTVLESVMLLKLMRCVNPDHVFEFGTYNGETARLIAENLADNGMAKDRIYTLDLPSTEGVTFQGTDQLLAERSVSLSRKYELSPHRAWVKQIYQDSMLFDGSDYAGKFQFILVDANHEVNYVRKDTENSFEMIGGDRACIVWHDYGNPQFRELTGYLDDLSNEKELYHIEGTMIAFWLHGLNVAAKGSWP